MRWDNWEYGRGGEVRTDEMNAGLAEMGQST